MPPGSAVSSRVAVWWAANTIYGDALFHLGRIRKLETFHLTSLNVVDEFRHGGLHPGYAFPLWHSAVALVARLADVDPAVALQHLPAILTPLAIVLAYAAGAALFRSFGGGVATAAAQAGLLGFSRAGTGSFDFLALPPTVARALITPALLALVFSVSAGGRRRGVLSIAAASLALALVHRPTRSSSPCRSSASWPRGSCWQRAVGGRRYASLRRCPPRSCRPGSTRSG